MDDKLPVKKLGDVWVTAVSDGYLEVQFGLLANVDEAECRAIQQNAGQEQINAVHINAFLVQQHGKNILIDSGAGGVKGWGGELVNNLAKLGLKPKDIDTILLTHAHPDHIGGLITSAGKMVFPCAQLIINQDEYNYIVDDKEFADASDHNKCNFKFARSIFKLYQNNLCLIDEGEVKPNIYAIAMKGHTPGHTGYKIEGSNESLLICGDIVHFPYIQLLKPNVSIALDYDSKLAVQTRVRILEIVSADSILVGGAHFGRQGFGYIKKLHTGYCIVAAD